MCLTLLIPQVKAKAEMKLSKVLQDLCVRSVLIFSLGQAWGELMTTLELIMVLERLRLQHEWKQRDPNPSIWIITFNSQDAAGRNAELIKEHWLPGVMLTTLLPALNLQKATSISCKKD